MQYKQPVEFYEKGSQIVFMALILVLSLWAIYFSVQKIIIFPADQWQIGSILLVGGVLFFIVILCMGIVFTGMRLIGRPVIRLDSNGIKHFLFGFIPWTDITRIYLIFFKVKSSEVSVLKIATTDNQYYLTRLNWWHRFFQGGKTDIELSVLLNLSEKDSRFVEGVAKGYAANAGAPTMETQLSKKIAEEISKLQTPQQRIERLQTLMADSSQEFIKRRNAISRTTNLLDYLLIVGVLTIFLVVWISSK
ncbi:MAG: hypothetical protein LUQ11_02575 [Methylococcaceae bacterium]|nr:hypothetical protein [Methylococcaceae bacterium]